MIGTRIGSWLITEEIGDGGHAFVFKGVNGQDVVAIKMLKPSVAGEDNLEKRFKAEAEALRSLNHEGVVGFRDYLYLNGYHYLILEYMDAGSVDILLRNVGPIESRYALPIINKVLIGLNYAHSFGYIHRDIKPNNILLNKRGEAKVTDFGIAKVVGGENLTRPGFVLGTTPYMAPEYLSQGAVSPQTDIYALGVTLYEMVTNRKPFEQKGDEEQLVDFAKRVCFGTPTPPSAYRPIPEELERILLRSITRDPKKRYKSVDRLQADLLKAFPDLMERPIEIPDGRPKTRAVAMDPALNVGQAPERVSKPGATSTGVARVHPGVIVGVALAVAVGVGATSYFALNLGQTLSALAAVLGGVLVLAVVYFLARRPKKPKTSTKSKPVPSDGRPPRQEAVPPKAAAPKVEADDQMPFHGGAAPQGEFQETHISELNAFLVITGGPHQGKRYGLRPVSRIGRDLRYDIRPHDPEISRHHALLAFNGTTFTVRDTGSTNGTFVNEERLTQDQEIALNPGDIVRVGRSSMRFEHKPQG